LVRGVGLEPSGLIDQIFEVRLTFAASLPSSALDESNVILLPSGDQKAEDTFAPAAVSLVRGVGFEPSAFITQRLCTPFVFMASVPSRARDEIKATLLPSGENSKVSRSTPAAVSLVSGAAPEPSAFIVQIFWTSLMFAASLPSRARLDANASVAAPTNLATNADALFAVNVVRGAAPVPSGFICQMLNVPFVFTVSLPSSARADSTISFLPSGDQPVASVKAPAAVSVVIGVAPEPSAFSIHAFMVPFVFSASLPSRARSDE